MKPVQLPEETKTCLVEVNHHGIPKPDSHAIIWVRDYFPERNNDAPHDLFIYRGWPNVIVKVMERAAAICGPFLVVCGSGESIVVAEGTPPDAEWR